MGSIDSRLRRLEEHDRGGGPECSGTASYVVVYGADTPHRSPTRRAGGP